jgi:solute:Na+ symporter, SSS family
VRTLAGLDWAIIFAYLALALVVGILMSRLAGRSMESYFVAGRALPWWWLGTSMVATTFAADTPLVVTGMVANYGIAGNWFWWSWALSYVSLAVIFAALWRRARVITDAELVELRYTGPSATLLRGFKAIFFAVLINGIILGWVIRAMSNIAQPFTDWAAWLGPARFQALEAAWPQWLLFGTLGDTLTVLALFALITLYSTMGGIRGVILTDLVQFAIALFASITFAWIAVQHLGGVGGLLDGLHARYPDADEILAFIPRRDAVWLPLHVFAIYLAVQWWAQYFADGSGYLAQRLNTARDDAHATGGALWFVVANFALRTWPWVLIGLVSLVVFPLGAEGTGEAAAAVAANREMAYPVLMAELLPVGLLGLMIASLLAAFMSTVDTHLNWGTSYLINDIYKRFLRPDASERELVAVSRATVVGLALLAIGIASQIATIEGAWRFFIALGAGLGLPAMVRWLWWRANAWTEIVGMTVAVLVAFYLYAAYPDARDEYLLVIIVAVSMTAAFTATFLTAPVPRAHLEAFVRRVRPPGFWRELPGHAPRSAFRWLAGGWLLGNVAVFGLTFGTGHLILGSAWLGWLLLLAGGAAVWLTLAATRKARDLSEPPARERADRAATGAGR